MKPGISFTKVWADYIVFEVMAVVCDGVSQFANTMYLGHDDLSNIANELHRFNILGGLYDLELGSFGPETANGGFHARLHFQASGKLHISTYQQSQHQEFTYGLVASEAKLYLKTERGLLDDFITSLSALSNSVVETATLECSELMPKTTD